MTNQPSPIAAAPGPAAPASDAGPTHACIRCGAPVLNADSGLCDDCNPLGLAQPSATQVHGIAALGIILAVVFMLIVGRMLVTGVGPFGATVEAVTSAGDGLAVTLTVANHGSKAGATLCTLQDPSARYGGADAYIQSPLIEAGASRTFTGEVAQFGGTPKPLTVACSNP